MKVPTYNPFDFSEKKTSNIKGLLRKKSSSKNNNGEFEIPLDQNKKSNSKYSNRSSMVKKKTSSFNNWDSNVSDLEGKKLSRNTSDVIKSAKVGKSINPCSSFS